jgi:hypothetical protein
MAVVAVALVCATRLIPATAARRSPLAGEHLMEV